MENVHRLDVKEPKLICLIILSAFASMGAVLMTPALPEIVRYFSITQGQAQLTVTLFLVGYAIGQLIYGPIANRYGRKPTFYIGIFIATIGSVFSILSSPAHSFRLLLTGRMLEALGSSVGLVISFTIISDFYYPAQSRRIMSYMMMAFAIVPGVAVFIGGFIAQYLNWESCFYFLLIYGLALIYPAYILPETISQVDKNAMKIKRIHRGYSEIFCNYPLVRYSLLFGFSALLGYVFSADGPFIGIHTLKYSASVYGMLAILPSAGMLIGAILSARSTERFSSRTLIYFGVCFEVIGALAMLLLFLFRPLSIAALLVPMFFIYLGNAFVCANASSSAMYFAVDKANGAAVMSFLCMLMTVAGTFTLAIIPSHSALVMPSIFMVAIAIILVFQASLKNHVIS
jgi:Bcr/CflA subfamily drug resistance transporter